MNKGGGVPGTRMKGFMNFKDPLMWGQWSKESGFGSELSNFLRRVPQTGSTCLDSGKMGERDRTNISTTSEDCYGGDTNQNTSSSNNVWYVVTEPGRAGKAEW